MPRKRMNPCLHSATPPNALFYRPRMTPGLTLIPINSYVSDDRTGEIAALLRFLNYRKLAGLIGFGGPAREQLSDSFGCRLPDKFVDLQPQPHVQPVLQNPFRQYARIKLTV